MLIVLTEELEILRFMQPLDRDVFKYLAERTDFDTGVVGVISKVSYGGMALDLSERDEARRTKASLRKVSMSGARNSVKRLVNSGLLQSDSKNELSKQLVVARVFWVSLLGLGHSVKNPDVSQMTVLLPGQLLKFNNIINKLVNNKELSCQSKNVSDARTSLYINNNRDSELENFLMHLDWTPMQSELELIVKNGGGQFDKVKPAWISGFISYWWGREDKRLNQRAWTAKLAMQLLYYLRDPSLFDSLQGVSIKQAKSDANYPEWARVPKLDEQLVPWMRRHGYGDPPAGMTYQQARAYAQRLANIKYEQWKKELS